MKFSILTLGCKSNQAESGQIENFFARNDNLKVPLEDSPDVCIINTCSVTAKSDYESRQLIRRAVKAGARVYVTGCYSELNQAQVKDLSSDICLIKNDDKISFFNKDILSGINKDMLSNISKDILSNISRDISGISCDIALNISGGNTLNNNPGGNALINPGDTLNTSRGRALVKIQDGCDCRCTYCIIPHARGNSRSRPIAGITDELRELESFHGYNEAVLTGIHVGFYGLDLTPRATLAGLVRNILTNTTRIRIRITSVEANEVTDELIELFKEPRVCSHIHVPLQSGDDNILIKMERHYTTSYFGSVIDKLYKTVDNISIGTDVIVGFPGETEESFSKTHGFISSLPLTYLHVFPYSKRKYTKAGLYPGHLNKSVKKQRSAILREHSEVIKGRYMERQVGRTLPAVVENRIQDKNTVSDAFSEAISYHLTTDNYLKATATVTEGELSKKCLINLRVTGVDGGVLVGEPVWDL
jgi:threonylcarbamoyladenosine tRNA methylthiotransferase MtaB